MQRQLRKIVYALNEQKLNKNIQAHKDRGWVLASDVKDHGYGLGVLMVWGQESPLEMKEKQ
jgi:hypothetical protein